MSKNLPNDDARIAQQIQQYANVESMHDALGEINEYWKKRHHRGRMMAATGRNNHLDVYADAIVRAFERSPVRRIASLGSGDGAVEVQIAQRLESRGITDYEFHLYELSPIQNERAIKKSESAQLAGAFFTHEANLNEWKAEVSFATFIAHHSLHHVVELEQLFDEVERSLVDGGTFATFDMIGRNGHMRWPETYAIVNAIWHFIPESKRRHSVLKWSSFDYRDHDCSTKGFEGIRSQDILPELMKRFQFETFFAWGGLTDVFVTRAFGPNYDPNNSDDTRTIDLIDELNEALLELRAIKPTTLCAVMQKDFVEHPRLYKDRTPEEMVRHP